jgi:hypothetical protein
MGSYEMMPFEIVPCLCVGQCFLWQSWTSSSATFETTFRDAYFGAVPDELTARTCQITLFRAFLQLPGVDVRARKYVEDELCTRPAAP